MKKRLINSINNYSRHLNKVSKWYSRPSDPFGHIDSKTQESYIYEFYCYIRFIKELKDVQNDIRINCTGSKGTSFPKGPAGYDNGYAKFEIFDANKVIFEVLAGISICHSSISNYSFAPDISIHTPANQINEESVIHFVDAKFKENKSDDIPIRQLREFKASMVDFNVPKSLFNIKLNGTSFPIPSIVTNGKTNPKHDVYASANNFQQIGDFKP